MIKEFNEKDYREMMYSHRLKFVRDMLDLIYGNQDIITPKELGMFYEYENEEEQLVKLPMGYKPNPVKVIAVKNSR